MVSIRKQPWTLAPRILQYHNYQWLFSAFPNLSPILNFSSSWASFPPASHSFITLTFQLCVAWVPSLFCLFLLAPSWFPLLILTLSSSLALPPPLLSGPIQSAGHVLCTAFSFCSELFQISLAVLSHPHFVYLVPNPSVYTPTVLGTSAAECET